MSGETRCSVGQGEGKESAENCYQVGYGPVSSSLLCSLCPWCSILMSCLASVKTGCELLRLLVEARYG